MPSIVPPSTDTQDQNTVVDALDWAPPCDYTQHDRFGAGPAQLAVMVSANACRCMPVRVVLNCEACFRHWTSTDSVRCYICGAVYVVHILRVERI